MPEILFIALLAIIALLSKPGRIAVNPVSGTRLTNIQSIVLQRGIASTLMTPVLLLVIAMQPFWIGMNNMSVVITVLMLLLVPVLSFFVVRPDQNAEPHEIYTGLQFGSPQWIAYLITSSAYMLLYEILLRGILLHYLTDLFGIVLAIILTTAIYVIMHLVKGVREAVLCIPLGIFLCWITLYTRSVWPAAVFHLVMALSFELFYNAKRRHVNA